MIDEIHAQLQKAFPSGFILLHKSGQIVEFKLSEFEFWLGYVEQFLQDERKVYREEVSDNNERTN